jgi:dTDP-4-dehydrorhamnose 3,5-epimerase
VLYPRRHYGERSDFSETFGATDFGTAVVPATSIQDKQAMSLRAGIIRGLRFQEAPNQQAKIVRVLRGAVFSVALGLRRGSPAFGGGVSATLTAEGGR